MNTSLLERAIISYNTMSNAALLLKEHRIIANILTISSKKLLDGINSNFDETLCDNAGEACRAMRHVIPKIKEILTFESSEDDIKNISNVISVLEISQENLSKEVIRFFEDTAPIHIDPILRR